MWRPNSLQKIAEQSCLIIALLKLKQSVPTLKFVQKRLNQLEKNVYVAKEDAVAAALNQEIAVVVVVILAATVILVVTTNLHVVKMYVERAVKVNISSTVANVTLIRCFN